jgi:hypothetical protein
VELRRFFARDLALSKFKFGAALARGDICVWASESLKNENKLTNVETCPALHQVVNERDLSRFGDN